MWIRIHKSSEYGSNTDPDPQHCYFLSVSSGNQCWLVPLAGSLWFVWTVSPGEDSHPSSMQLGGGGGVIFVSITVKYFICFRSYHVEFCHHRFFFSYSIRNLFQSNYFLYFPKFENFNLKHKLNSVYTSFFISAIFYHIVIQYVLYNGIFDFVIKSKICFNRLSQCGSGPVYRPYRILCLHIDLYQLK